MKSIRNTINRRRFLKTASPAAAALIMPELATSLVDWLSDKKDLTTKGVVLTVEDLETLDWPLLAHKAGLTTIGTHIFPEQVAKFITTDKGQQFLSDCKKYNIQVEHELHSMRDLLPRSYFDTNPEMFRMNEKGVRVKDYNCCPHSEQALIIIAENALRYADILTPTTMRFFYWIDDAVPMCKCNLCKDFNDADQALLIENAIIRALRQKYPAASLAHLAYVNTMIPPAKVKPEEGIFLEFAPIYRQWDKPLSDGKAGIVAAKQDDGSLLTHAQTMELLHENLNVFPAATAQVLEYWLDVSLQSQWKKPAKKISWYPEVCKKDVAIYKKAGIKHITTFAVYVDGNYKKQYGNLDFINEYGKILTRS